MGYFPVRYDPRVVIYERKMFIRLATAVQWYFTKRWAFSALKLGCLVSRYCIIHIFYNYGPIPASFCIFSLFSHYITIMQIEKKHRCCAWDSNPGPQDGRRRRNHRAMAATPNSYYFFSSIFLALPLSTKSLSKWICVCSAALEISHKCLDRISFQSN